MDTVIPTGVDPTPALDKIMSHFTRLNKMNWEIPKKVIGMMMIVKAPSSMESIVQLYSTILTDATLQEQEDKSDPEKIALAMRGSWETHGRAGMSQSNQQRVNKLSAAKPAGNQPHQFQYQQQHGESLQQQHSGWGLGGGSKRGQ